MFVIFQLCLYSVIVNVNFNLQSACLRVSSTTCTLQSSMQNIVDGYRLLLLTLVDVQYPSIRCMSKSAIGAAGTAALTTTTHDSHRQCRVDISATDLSLAWNRLYTQGTQATVINSVILTKKDVSVLPDLWSSDHRCLTL